MALHAPVLVMKDSLKRESGAKVHKANIQAAKAVADIIRTTLGPRSMLKMLLDAGRCGRQIFSSTALSSCSGDHTSERDAKKAGEKTKFFR
ncbi:hypothetical protein ZEAMMB73_Zm00001d015221 [Zea mays]|uniref:T-complex protein 1 subunit gamma n=2 Tax=Zea mays TaxID=4577 RepID=A0A1D6H076_MAIZE|nr:hypothetical protein ZEAMMB73_Zm00001d015221 [Zea mays]